MRRDKRGMYEETDNYKAILIVAGIILLVAIISFFVIYGIYNDKLESVKLATSNESGSKIEISKNNEGSTEVSSSIGKNIEEAKNDSDNSDGNSTEGENANSGSVENTGEKPINISGGNNSSTTGNVDTNVKKDTKAENGKNVANDKKIEKETSDGKNTTSGTDNQEKTKENNVEEKEPKFIIPVEDGEIIREYAKDNLVFSETLQEWITHLGIDIKAPKTTIVKAAEIGEVESVKNDPRYGLTVMVKHSKGYKTVYANLLTTEFVNVGDKVEKGQSIGTVGNNAPFEIADDPHLHFELIKDDEKIDPNVYF